MTCWKTTVRVRSGEAKLLVTDELGDDVLRARLPRHPEHPRALLTLLEGVALWSGSPVTAAISVDESALCSFDRDLFGGVLWPADSALVRVHLVEDRRRRRLRGLGDFREVLQIHGAGS